MKISAKTVMLSLTALFLVFVCGIVVGNYWGASVPLADVSSLVPTELPISQIDDEYAVVDGKININKASPDALSLLPGISYNMALKIVAYRESVGPFEHIDQLRNIDGFGEKRLIRIADYITVGD